jgi:hypothetical protein
MFIPVIIVLARTLIKLFFQSKIYFIILFVFLIRGWTDSIFFLGEYDFLIIIFILLTGKIYSSAE